MLGVEDVSRARHQRAGVGQELFFDADEEDDRKLEPLGAVQRGQRDLVAAVFILVVLRFERQLAQVVRERRRARRALLVALE